MTSRQSGSVTVTQPGPMCTVQDEGRIGLATLGIGRSGAADRGSYRLANRLVGNDEGVAALEVTFGGLTLQPDTHLTVALTGAPCSGVPHNAVVTLEAGSTLRLAAPSTGLRTYVGVRGGILVPEVLGSRSTDLLSELGPAPLAAGDVLPVGPPPARYPNVDVAPRAEPAPGEVTVRVTPGPRRDWFCDAAWDSLLESAYDVTSDSNRVGVRLDGPALERTREGELPSEGLMRGALQVPPSGKPVLFLADHPVTGGYPVIGYVRDDDVDLCAQVRPGQTVRFRSSV